MAEKPVSGGFLIHSEGGKKMLTLSKDFKTSIASWVFLGVNYLLRSCW